MGFFFSHVFRCFNTPIYHKKHLSLIKTNTIINVMSLFVCCLFANEDLILVFTIWDGQTADSLVSHRYKFLSFEDFEPFFNPTWQCCAVQCCQIGSHDSDMCYQTANDNRRNWEIIIKIDNMGATTFSKKSGSLLHKKKNQEHILPRILMLINPPSPFKNSSILLNNLFINRSFFFFFFLIIFFSENWNDLV